MSTANISYISKEIGSKYALDYNKARTISEAIVRNWCKDVILNFSWIETLMSPFAREILTPLIKNKIQYSVTDLNAEYMSLIQRIEGETTNGVIDFRNTDLLNM